MSESIQPAVLAAGEGRAIRIRNGNVIFKTVGAETNGQVGIFEQTMQKGDPGPVPATTWGSFNGVRLSVQSADSFAV